MCALELNVVSGNPGWSVASSGVYLSTTTLIPPVTDPRFTPAMQREAAGPMLELLRAERSQLVKEAVGATCAIAEHMGRDLAPFAVAVFKELVAATGAGSLSPAPRKRDSSAVIAS